MKTQRVRRVIHLISAGVSIQRRSGPTYCFGAPAATVTHIRAVQVLDVYLVHHFWVLFLDLQVDQAVLLFLLLGQEWAYGQIAQQSQDTQEGQQPEPLGH